MVEMTLKALLANREPHVLWVDRIVLLKLDIIPFFNGLNPPEADKPDYEISFFQIASN